MKKRYDVEKLKAKVNALVAGTKTVKKDSDGYWQPSTDKSGYGSAILRFLPPLPDEEFPFVLIFNHAFQVEKTWFIANCPTTRNLPCPVCESNTVLWNGPNKSLASIRKRKMNYVSNVLVVCDPKQPENEGKVFLFKYGVRIFDKIKFSLDPIFSDAESVDPFDAEEGANFRLRITRNGGFPDYEKSTFDAPSPIGGDDVIASVLSQRRSLDEIVAPYQFKSYDELKRKFDLIVTLKAA